MFQFQVDSPNIFVGYRAHTHTHAHTHTCTHTHAHTHKTKANTSMISLCVKTRDPHFVLIIKAGSKTVCLTINV